MFLTWWWGRRWGMVGWCSCWLGCGEYSASCPLIPHQQGPFCFKVLPRRGAGGLTDDPREMAIGNTFGATALSSYGGFWISIAIILTPGGFQIEEAYTSSDPDGFAQAFALYLFAWTILTFFFLLCTLKSTVAFFTLFALLDLAFLFLACAYQNSGPGDNEPHVGLLRAGGAFGVLAAFAAWYNALAGLMDSSNR